MGHLKKIGSVLLILALISGATLLTQTFNSTYAANTLLGENEIITINNTTDGLPLDAPFAASGYSADGNVILFASSATNLPNAGGPGGFYTYNIRSGLVKRVDISTSGVQANAGAFLSRYISETGRYVTFGSSATNLIDGSTSAIGMYYKHDTQTGVTTYIGGNYSNGLSQNWDRNLGVSNDGRFVLMASRNKANSYPYNYGIVLGEEVNGAYEWTQLAKDNGGGQGSANSTAVLGGLSCDGAFATYQVNRTIGLADLRKGTIIKLTAGSDTSISPIISCNGRYVLYATKNRTDIIPTPSGMNTNFHLVRYDRISGEHKYIDSDSSGVFGNGWTWNTMSEPPINIANASISDTGDVVFSYNGTAHLKHFSDESETLEPVAKKIDGTYYTGNYGATITRDGRYIFLNTDPYNLGLTSSPSTSKLIRTKTNL